MFLPVLVKRAKCAVSGRSEESVERFTHSQKSSASVTQQSKEERLSQPLINLEIVFVQEVSSCSLQSTSTSWCTHVSAGLGKVNQLHLQNDKECFFPSHLLKVHPECASTRLPTSDKQGILCILSLWTQYCSI